MRATEADQEWLAAIASEATGPTGRSVAAGHLWVQLSVNDISERIAPARGLSPAGIRWRLERLVALGHLEMAYRPHPRWRGVTTRWLRVVSFPSETARGRPDSRKSSKQQIIGQEEVA